MRCAVERYIAVVDWGVALGDSETDRGNRCEEGDDYAHVTSEERNYLRRQKVSAEKRDGVSRKRKLCLSIKEQRLVDARHENNKCSYLKSCKVHDSSFKTESLTNDP